MDAFIINKSQDAEAASRIVDSIRQRCFSFNPLVLENTNKLWKIDATAKIRKCQLAIFIVSISLYIFA